MEGIKHYLTDMDGVLVHGPALLRGAIEFVQKLRVKEIPLDFFPNKEEVTKAKLALR